MKLIIYATVMLVLVYPGNATFKIFRKPFKQITKHGLLGSGFGDAITGFLRYAPAFYDTTHKVYDKFFGSHHKHKSHQYAPDYHYGGLDDHGSSFGHFDDYILPHQPLTDFYTPSFNSFSSFDDHYPSFKDVLHHTDSSDFFHYPKLYENHDFFRSQYT